jgi:putative methyltransferase (TIGR04325 family)
MGDRDHISHIDAKRFFKAVTPPIVLLAVKEALVRLGLRGVPPVAVEPEAGPSMEQPPATEQPSEWEYVPEGWTRQRTDPRVKGWNVEAIVEAYRAKWPSYVRALQGTGPLNVYHEVLAGDEVGRHLDASAHNMLISYAYVLALAAREKSRVSILDWGGGSGHYYLLSKAVLPGVKIDYHCKDVPKLCAYGRELFPEAHFFEDESCLDSRYDLVLASGSLQYSEDWQGTLAGLSRATGGYLYVTRLPICSESPPFVVLQRAYAYSYDTEYLGWVLNRNELLARAADDGANLVREFFLLSWTVPGAPENPVQLRGFLFEPRSS